MDNKKNFGSFFREKLNGLNHNPSDHLWSKIENDLNSKQRKKFMLWGLASLFVLSIGIGFWLQADQVKNVDHIETAVTGVKSDTKTATTADKKMNIAIQSETLPIVQAKTSKMVDTISTDYEQDSIKNKINYKLLNKKSKLVKSTEKYDLYEVTSTYSYVVLKKKEAKSLSYKKSKKGSKTNLTSVKNKKANYRNFNKLSKNKKTIAVRNKSSKKQLANLGTPLKIEKDYVMVEKEMIAETQPIVKSTAEKVEVSDKKQPLPILKKPRKNAKPADSISIPKEETDFNARYYLTPYFGLSSYQNFENENPISTNTADYTVKSNTSITFGCYLRGMFTEKLGLRIGLANHELKRTISATKTDNKDFDFSNVQLEGTISQTAFNNLFTAQKIVQLNQKLTYYEFPVEGYYVFSDKKFGFATAAGVSLMVLNLSTLHLQSADGTENVVGYTRNTNTLSNTINAQLYFTYKLSRSINFEISPSFKYHLKDSQNVPNLNPYIITVQSGFSYKL